MKKLETYDDNGKPKVVPTYFIGVVANRGSDLPMGKNHSDYVNTNGKYDIVEFITDHCKDLKYLYNVAVGKLAPPITTEVDCEYLFTMAFHISHQKHSRTTVETFEILVIAKH